jgi:hypothetical protein
LNLFLHILRTGPGAISLGLTFPFFGLLGNKVQSVDELEVAELEDLPTLKTFMHYVHANQPFVVRGAVHKMGLVERWTDEYLKSKIGNNIVSVRLSKYKVSTRL